MKKQKPDWLIDIQNKSWEPELFILGGAIFFLLQLTDFVHKQSFLMVQRTGFAETAVMANYVMTAFNVLIFGFALHLCFRGLWAASVCLSYVFPEGIRLSHIENYAPPFKKRVQKVRDTVDWVMLLENFCSLVFMLSFLFFIIILGVLFTLIVLIPHSGLEAVMGVNAFRILQITAVILLLLLGGLYMIDFLTLGYIKRQKKITKFYYPVYWFFSIVTFAPLYRSYYYTLITNIKPWQMLFTIALYIGVGFGITQTTRNSALFGNINGYLDIHNYEHSHDLRYYEDTREEETMINQACIQSEIIEGNYIRLFVVHQKIIEKRLKQECKEEFTKNESLKCQAKLYQIYIDNQLQKNVSWRHYEHPRTGEKGLITFLSIKDLQATQHMLTVKINTKSKEKLKELEKVGIQKGIFATIPFWKN